MNPKSAALLADPHPCGHIVYPYTDKNLVGQAVCLYASAGLRNGEAVILIVRQANYETITSRLWREGFDLQTLQRTGQLTLRLAEDVLPTFMVDGMPDRTKFHAIVADLLSRARISNTQSAPRVRAFGEMVCILWRTNLPAAARLEQLWSEAIETFSLSLLCTYELGGTAPPSLAEELAACHSHNLA